jgi:hypothetical protein
VRGGLREPSTLDSREQTGLALAPHGAFFVVDRLSPRIYSKAMDADKLSNLTVTTTDGTLFTGEDTALLARLIHRRFGRDDEAAAAAWRRMLGNSTPTNAFMELVNHEPEVCETFRSTLRESSPLSPVISVHRDALHKALRLMGERG